MTSILYWLCIVTWCGAVALTLWHTEFGLLACFSVVLTAICIDEFRLRRIEKKLDERKEGPK